uniref:Autophagy-related protein n=1 Tax=Chromera velia CCMP2878 TaxID=1169474 RepID=A0A0G4F1A1_9ALVE|mmetsp:Transcript_25237/g.49321  ORF Transcript_25237/g.49321 Transcript_25237/m.49321 type:complete len:137 (+) Transcript_25237:200-610(+)|eukprot:Cvel_14496.t1-p1 / transcript=Cvel_14496.t1 / gene=Cvel_14496 / organism=Chromera_velia_CCMP2878 / gene_product=Autophagy-related protein 8, putative / transcript_product=Autophagy-related protein 8, putative / location=Cvel_scaffold1033:55444-57492(+) / protein_length=136 / sequence_SO=supercontig / SO=protein_coding / is_pseudo=false
MPSIREEIPFEKRSHEAQRIRAKYPNRIPVICEKSKRSDLPEIDKRKFLVPMNMLVGEFKYIIHKHINQCAQNSGITMAAEKTIYLHAGRNTNVKTGSLISEIYDQYKDPDGFLYFEYSAENTLGGLGAEAEEIFE